MKLTIDDFDIEDKTVLVRIDVNSPVDPGSGIILDDTRLKLHAQTIKELLLFNDDGTRNFSTIIRCNNNTFIIMLSTTFFIFPT